MKKIKYTKGLVKRATMAKTERLGPLFKSREMKPVKVDHRVIAEQVAASMAIEDRTVQPEDIIVESSAESRKAVADVLSIRLQAKGHHRPPGDATAGS